MAKRRDAYFQFLQTGSMLQSTSNLRHYNYEILSTISVVYKILLSYVPKQCECETILLKLMNVQDLGFIML